MACAHLAVQTLIEASRAADLPVVTKVLDNYPQLVDTRDAV